MLILYRLVVKPVAIARYLTLAALLLATGMLSHYEGALAALPAAFLLAVLFWQQRARWKELLGAVVIAALAGGALLALFYVPYVVNPRFAATYQYLTDRRIGGSPPYNNLADVFLRTTLYSTTYYVGLLIVLTAAAAVRLIWGNFRRGVAIVLSVAGGRPLCAHRRAARLGGRGRPRLDHRALCHPVRRPGDPAQGAHRRAHGLALVRRRPDPGPVPHREAAHPRLHLLHALGAADRQRALALVGLAPRPHRLPPGGHRGQRRRPPA